MSNKGKRTSALPWESSEEEPTIEVPEVSQEPSQPVVPPFREDTYYLPYLWKDLIPGFKCVVCDLHIQGSSKDDMQLHVLRHVPPEDRNALLDKLVKASNLNKE